MAGEARQLLAGLHHRLGAKRVVAEGIVHVGEHEVLPHENAELVADAVEIVRLVDHRPGDAQHVRARIAHLLERGAQLARARAQPEDVERRPARAAAEDALAVHHEFDRPVAGERIAAAHLDPPEAEGSAIDRRPLATDAELDLARVPRWRAVRMRPPEGDAGYRDVAADRDRALRAAALDRER